MSHYWCALCIHLQFISTDLNFLLNPYSLVSKLRTVFYKTFSKLFYATWEWHKTAESWKKSICDLAPCVQFEKREKHPRRNATFSLKVKLLHRCFSRFLNCTNGTKSHKASHMNFLQMQALHCAFTLIFDHVFVRILNTLFFTFSLIRNFWWFQREKLIDS